MTMKTLSLELPITISLTITMHSFWSASKTEILRKGCDGKALILDLLQGDNFVGCNAMGFSNDTIGSFTEASHLLIGIIDTPAAL
jgi:hypothetical protein